MLRLPDPCLVVLVGPSGSGKSTWAEEQFPAGAVVSADRLRAHCADVGRDPAAITVTQLSSASVTEASGTRAAVTGSVEELVGHYRTLAEAGVQTAIVRLSPLDEQAVADFAPVIAAFAQGAETR